MLRTSFLIAITTGVPALASCGGDKQAAEPRGSAGPATTEQEAETPSTEPGTTQDSPEAE